MKDRSKLTRHFAITMAIAVVIILSGISAASADQVESARKAVEQAMTEVGTKKNDAGVLLLTNAVYGQINGQGAEKYRDLLSEATGCTLGKHSMLDVHTSFNAPLWFSLFRKGSNKLVFCKWQKDGFQSQTIDATPKAILSPAAWKKASEGLIGKKALYQVVSISLAWSEDVAWPIMKAASFHDHLCPGVNVGYLIHLYLKKHLPLEKGESYRFFGAVPKCYMDALQVIYNTTLGKQAAFGVAMTDKQLAKYETDGSVPCVVAIKVNKKKNTCQGVVLGFSWKRIMDDLGLKLANFDPPKGQADPVFFVTRAEACWKMAQMKQEDKLPWVAALKTFSGDAKLAHRICNAGGNPYAVVWAK